MKLVEVVIRGLEKLQHCFGGPQAGQPEYLPLHCLLTEDGAVVSRWSPTKEERLWIANGSDIYLSIYTFGGLYPPTMMQVFNTDTAMPPNQTVEERAALYKEHFKVIEPRRFFEKWRRR